MSIDDSHGTGQHEPPSPRYGPPPTGPSYAAPWDRNPGMPLIGQESGRQPDRVDYQPPAINHYVTVLPTKSVGLAVLLAFLFGPLGMLYATVAGALVMFLVNLVVFFLTFGLGLMLTWPVCMVWAGFAVTNHNQQLSASVARARY